MATPISILRRKYPWITPPFVDEEEPPILRRAAEPPAGPAALAAPPLIRRPEVAPIMDTINLPPIASTDLMRIGARPVRRSVVDNPLQRETDYLDQLTEYRPNKGRSAKRTLLSAALGFLQGGIPGAIGSAATQLINPNIGEEQWRDREIGRSEDNLNRIGTLRRQGLQERLLESQIAENAAQLENMGRPKIEYDWMPNPSDPLGSDIYAPKTPGTTRLVREKPEKEPAGFTLPPGGARYDAKGNLIIERPSSEKPDTASFTNEQLQRNISDAQTEQAKIDTGLTQTQARLAQTPPTINGYDNPEYTALQSLIKEGRDRRQQLDDQIRRARADLKPLTRSGGREDAKVRQYANEFFRGDYKAAEEAIRKQRGQ